MNIGRSQATQQPLAFHYPDLKDTFMKTLRFLIPFFSLALAVAQPSLPLRP